MSDKNIQPNSQEVVPVYREHYLLSRDDPISYKKRHCKASAGEEHHGMMENDQHIRQKRDLHKRGLSLCLMLCQ